MSKIFYHVGDLDGKSSGALAHIKYPQAELIGIEYGDGFPWQNLESGEVVFMVDFSLSPFSDMEKLNKLAKLTLIDHHSTLIKQVRKSKMDFEGIQESGAAACELLWRYFYPRKGVPWAIRLLSNYDIWNHKDPNVLPFQFGMRAYDCDPGKTEFWLNLITDDGSLVKQIIAEGRAILRYKRQTDAVNVKNYSFLTTFYDLQAIAINMLGVSSAVFDTIWDPAIHDIMVIFGWRNGNWRVSIYTKKEEIDCACIAQFYGGGGHRQAAGFVVPKIPFELPEQKRT